MRREAVLAIVIGFSVGLLICAGLLLGRKSIRQKIKLPQWPPRQMEEAQPPAPTKADEISVAPTTSKILTITSPEDESIANEEKITLEGKTAPGAIISVVYEEGEALGEADESGKFNFEIPLIGGVNEITVTAYDTEGKETSKTLTVVYTTAEI